MFAKSEKFRGFLFLPKLEREEIRGSTGFSESWISGVCFSVLHPSQIEIAAGAAPPNRFSPKEAQFFFGMR